MGRGGHRGKRGRALIQSRSGKRLKRTEERFVAGAAWCHCWYPSKMGPGGDGEGNNVVFGHRTVECSCQLFYTVLYFDLKP